MSGDTFEYDDRSGAGRIIGTLHDPAATPGDVLTVQADKSIKAQPGGGGSGGVQVVTVPVSSAEILDLFNTPKVLVPGVAGSAIIVLAASILYQAGLVSYLSGGGSLSVATLYASDPTQDVVWRAIADAGFIDQATDQIVGGSLAQTLDSQTQDPAEWDGQGVVLLEDTGNPTLGDGTLLVTVSYFLAPTA